MAVNWVQSYRWKQTQPYTEFNVNVWHVWLIYYLVLTSRKKQFICRHESGGWLKIREGCAPKKDVAIVV